MKYQIFVNRGNGPELDGCWGSEHAQFKGRWKAIKAALHLSKLYPDCEWLVCNLDGSNIFDRITIQKP